MVNKELQETVLVVPRKVIDELCPKAFGRRGAEVEKAVLANYRFLERTIAEHDFTHKQVIPYVVIRHADRFLLIRRTKKQTESRLHDMFSLGIGGHINNTDVTGANGNILATGLRRELEEEIRVEDEKACTLVGVINDDSTEVARVHAGLVYVLTVGSPRFTIVEHDKYTASWATPEEMSRVYDQMESWAQIVHDFVVCTGAPDRIKKWQTAG